MNYVFFGNLTVDELKQKHKLSISDEEIKELEKYRSDNTKLKNNTFHIFDEPQCIQLKGKEVKNEIISILGKYSKEFKNEIKVYEVRDDK